MNVAGHWILRLVCFCRMVVYHDGLYGCNLFVNAVMTALYCSYLD